jgi:N-methylhydantoinase A
MWLVGIDVGGTFTDLVLTNSTTNLTSTHKVSSTPDDIALGILTGLTELCARADVLPHQVDHIYHGTTVATNAALQYRGARAGMITTEGFRDIIHIGRHQRPQHYSIQQDIPWQSRPLVERRFRKTVRERLIPPNGDILVPLDAAEVEHVADELVKGGVEAIAICFLFSYLNPAHEKRAAEIIKSSFPSLFVTCSHEVTGQYREFERFTTTAMNAFIGPLVRNYVQDLEQRLHAAGFQARLHIMCSSGGVAPPAMVCDLPVLTLMSGLAAGILGGAWIGRQTRHADLITLDIGGTSADIGVITNGEFTEASARESIVADYPILSPMIDIHTIGAGGGSIARVDLAGAFKVGPQSAGAVPGPAAYGRGGALPTVTDAHVVLGTLDRDSFLAGAMQLDAARSQAVIAELAAKLDMDELSAAAGVVTLINANMANAIRARTIQKGIDPRGYALLAAGGAGPLHAVDVARMLQIPTVIVPSFPGIASAMGLLTTDLKYDRVRTSLQRLSQVDLDRINADLEHMRSELSARYQLDGIEAQFVTYRSAADVRYVGQGYELRVPLPDHRIGDGDIAHLRSLFDDLHAREYGHAFPASDLEIVNVRVSGVGEVPKIKPREIDRGGTLEQAWIKSAPVTFRVGQNLETVETAFYQREFLPVGATILGPAVILQMDATTVLPPQSRATCHSSGSLLIDCLALEHAS